MVVVVDVVAPSANEATQLRRLIKKRLSSLNTLEEMPACLPACLLPACLSLSGLVVSLGLAVERRTPFLIAHYSDKRQQRWIWPRVCSHLAGCPPEAKAN